MEPSSTLDLTVLSCKDLKAFNFFHKLSPYTAVSLFSDPNNKSNGRNLECQRQKTPVDRAGNRNPEWNYAVSFDLRAYKSSSTNSDWPGDSFVMFEVRCEGTVFGNRTVGEVRVPLADLIGEFYGAPRFLSYQVKNSEGRANGVLNFSYKLNGKFIDTISRADNRKFKPTLPSRGVQELKYHAPEVIQVIKPKDISYPSIDIDDIRSTSVVPPILIRQTNPHDYNVFHVENNRQDASTYSPYGPVPVPGQNPNKNRYGYYFWGQSPYNQLRI